MDPVAGTFSYIRRDPALTGLTYSVWTSADLATWTEDTGAIQTPGATDGNGNQSVEVAVSASPEGGKLFAQIRAE